MDVFEAQAMRSVRARNIAQRLCEKYRHGDALAKAIDRTRNSSGDAYVFWCMVEDMVYVYRAAYDACATRMRNVTQS